jgi:hypothetical protein
MEQSAGTTSESSLAATGPPAALVALLLGAWTAHLIVYGLLVLPTDWDSLAYHIPIVDHWVQHRHLHTQDCAFWYVPGNNELLAFWFVAPFSGDFFVHLNNCPAVLLLACSLIAGCQSLGVSAIGSSTALLCVTLTQPVIRQATSAENDVAVAALFVAGAFFGWRYAKCAAIKDLVCFSLAVGLLSGVKYYALGYAVAAVAAPVVHLVTLGKRRLALQMALAAVAAIATLGAYWYIRNWLLTGTPIYPKGFLGASGPWDQMRPHLYTSTLLGNGNGEVWPLLLRALLSQGGPLTGTIAAATPVVALFLFIGGRHDLTVRWWTIVMCTAAVVYVVTPNVVETSSGSLNVLRSEYHPTRFGMPFLAASVVAASAAGRCLGDLLPKWLAIGANVFVLLGAGFQSLWHLLPLLGIRTLQTTFNAIPWDPPIQIMATEFAIVFIDVLLLRAVLRLFWKRQILALWKWAIIAAVFVLISVMLGRRWHDRFDPHFAAILGSRAPIAVRSEIRPSDRVCICEHRYYPFIGAYRQYSVCRPLWLPTKQALQEYLDRESATHVLVTFDDHYAPALYSNVRSWIAPDSSRFQQVVGIGFYELYRLRHERDDREKILPRHSSSVGWEPVR